MATKIMRDLKKEADWERQKYKRYQYRCPKDTAAQLDEKLKGEGLTWSKWIKRKISEYLGGRE